jgi:metallo-beta-lactamase family protein
LFNPAEIDFVLLTHAHVDHCGLIPKLFKHGFKGPVYTTKATAELCSIVLPDSAHIQEMEVERKNRKNMRSGSKLLEPIYTVDDARRCQENFRGCGYEETLELAPGIKVRFQDAGHILGSAMIELYAQEGEKERKIVFSGDIGNINQPIVDDPTKIYVADIVVMESTYGNRYHLEAENKLDLLASVIKSTLKKGGNLIVPSFAVERTQDLIFDLKMLSEQGRIPHVDVYIDSPMAVEATQVFINNHEFCTDEAFCQVSGEEAQKFFQWPNLHYVITAEQSMALNKIKGGAIIISASGMADAGRIKHHLKHNLWRPESTILFVGYQAEGTLGRRILEGEKRVRIHGEEVAVRADIVKIEGFSSHADQKGLLEWLKAFKKKPEKLFLVHGETDSLETLQRVIQSETGQHAEIPAYGAQYDLETDAFEKAPELAAPAGVKEMPELELAFQAIKHKIEELARVPGKDTRTLQRLLAQLSEVEREIKRAG